VGAVLAGLDMTAQRCGTANLDRGHDAPVGRGSDAPCWRRAKRRRGGGRTPHLFFGIHLPGSS
jgi:hypothetical protein